MSTIEQTSLFQSCKDVVEWLTITLRDRKLSLDWGNDESCLGDIESVIKLIRDVDNIESFDELDIRIADMVFFSISDGEYVKIELFEHSYGIELSLIEA